MKLRHGRMRWLLGVCAAWSLAWMVLGVQTFQRMSASPHPFLRDQKINHVLVRAIVDWTAQSLLEHLGFGLITGLIVLTFFAFRSGGRTDSILTFRGGLAVGGACILFAHAVLYLMVPGAITTVSGLNRLPMGPMLLALFLCIVSIGVATMMPDVRESAEGLVGAADHALYAAKRAGRNRISRTPA